MIKLKLHTSEEGFEWSDKNVWSGAPEYGEILHPIGDPTYNKTHTKEVEEDYSIWSDYLQCQKGRFEAHRKTNLINFANKYGFDKFVPSDNSNTLMDSSNPLIYAMGGVYPPRLNTIYKDMKNLDEANKFYVESGTFSVDALHMLNRVSHGIKTEFTKEGIQIVCSNTISAIWLTWSMSVSNGNMKVCSVCDIPYFTKRSNSESCGGGCRNKKSELKKGEK